MGHVPVGMMLRLNSRKTTGWKMSCSRVELDLDCAIVVGGGLVSKSCQTLVTPWSVAC